MPRRPYSSRDIMAAEATAQAVVALSAITLPDGGDDLDDDLSSSSSDSSHKRLGAVAQSTIRQATGSTM